jgi:hypothetical protein
MKCPRCNGFMTAQTFVQSISSTESWKCINCGNIVSGRDRTLEFGGFSLFQHQQKDRKKKE